MKYLTLMMAYYNNPTMLALQYSVWAAYPDDIKDRIEIVITDDGSHPDERAVDVPRPEGLPPLRIYRVLKDMKWHQNGARNLCAHHAKGDWLLMTDMDHVIPSTTIRALFNVASTRHYYKFRRWDFATGRPTLDRLNREKPHPNTFAMAKDLYWRVGGYDERTCGHYGTDSIFKRKLVKEAGEKILPDKVWRYSNDDVPDASTRGIARKEGRRKGWREALISEIERDPVPRNLLFEWTQDL